MTLIKNPFWPGTPSAPVSKVDEVKLTYLDETAAFAEYEAGNLDFSDIPSGDMDRVMTDPSLFEGNPDVARVGRRVLRLPTTPAAHR